MSWEHELFALFDDLEGHAAALWEADREAELADRAPASTPPWGSAGAWSAEADRTGWR